MKVIEWVKANAVVSVVLVAALILLFFSGSTIKKTQEKLVVTQSESVSLKSSYDSLSKEYTDYKKTFSQDLEWVSEPVLGSDGKALLDGQGHAIFRKHLTKKIDATASGSTTVIVQAQAVTQLVYAEAQTIVQTKIETVGKQNRVALYMGATLDAINPSMLIKTKIMIGGSVRVFKGLGAGSYVTTPLTFKKEGVELYLGPAFWW